MVVHQEGLHSKMRHVNYHKSGAILQHRCYQVFQWRLWTIRRWRRISVFCICLHCYILCLGKHLLGSFQRCEEFFMDRLDHSASTSCFDLNYGFQWSATGRPQRGRKIIPLRNTWWPLCSPWRYRCFGRKKRKSVGRCRGLDLLLDRCLHGYHDLIRKLQRC